MQRLLLSFALLALVAACTAASEQRMRNLLPDQEGEYTLWWNDEIKKEEGSARGGKRHGEVRRFFNDGSLEFTATFVSGMPEGRIVSYHRGAGPSRVEIVKDNVLDGLVEDYYPDGSLGRLTPYDMGVRQGEELGWHPNGTLALRRGWDKGLGVGRWVEYDDRNRLQRTEHRWVREGLDVGYIETVYTADGAVSVQTRLGLDDGVWRGQQTTWHDNGVQAALVDLHGGMREGRDLSWSRTGQLIVQGQRYQDERHGVWISWDADGRERSRAEYVNGEALEPAGPQPEG